MFYTEGIHKIYHPLKLDRFALSASNKSVIRVFVYKIRERRQKWKEKKINENNTHNSIIVKTKGSLNVFHFG